MKPRKAWAINVPDYGTAYISHPGERYVDFLQRMCSYFGGPIAQYGTIHHVEIREVKRKAKRARGRK